MVYGLKKGYQVTPFNLRLSVVFELQNATCGRNLCNGAIIPHTTKRENCPFIKEKSQDEIS